MHDEALHQLPGGYLKRNSKPPDATASYLSMKFWDCCPQPIKNSKYFFLTDCAPILELPPPLPLHTTTALSIATVNSKQLTSLKEPRWLQDSGHFCLLYLAQLLVV